MYSADERPVCPPITRRFSTSSPATASSPCPIRQPDGFGTRCGIFTSTKSGSCATAWSQATFRNRPTPAISSNSASDTGCFRFRRICGLSSDLKFLTFFLLPFTFFIATTACRQSSVARDAQRTTRTEVHELSPAPGALALPLKEGSVRFAVIGDSGRGDQAQQEVARQMVAWRAKFPFDFVVMLGDNIYPPRLPDDFQKKFEEPYRPLLDAGVTFYATIGNHDPDIELNYPKFNMDGHRYYTFRKNERRLEGLVGAGVRFFVLDSRALDP